jgi:uncharacterized protein YbbK (DUF523 family)
VSARAQSPKPKAQSPKPRVGISRCLLGEAVRYDGTDKRADGVLDDIGEYVEWVPVCPEVEIGMGTPREPIHLVPAADGVVSGTQRVRLVGVESGTDWTERMDAWAHERVRGLEALHLSGYIFKARSPSCGIGEMPGLFARAVMQAMPDLPIADEDDLADPHARSEFLRRVRAYA